MNPLPMLLDMAVPGLGRILSSLPWKWIAVACVVGALVFAVHHDGYRKGAASRQAEISARDGTISNLRAASAQAQAENRAYVVRINALQEQITKDQEHAKDDRLAAGSAAIDAWVRLHPAPKANSSSTGQGGAPGIPNAPSQPDEAPDAAIVSRADLDACNDAYSTAVGLQDWIRAQSAIAR